MRSKILAPMARLRLTKGLFVILFAMTILQMTVPASAQNGQIGVNVLLKTDVTDETIGELGKYGVVLDTLLQIKAVHMSALPSAIAAIESLPEVEVHHIATPDGQPVVIGL